MIFFAFKDGEKQIRVLQKLHVSHFSETKVTYLQLSLKFSEIISFQIELIVKLVKFSKKGRKTGKKLDIFQKKNRKIHLFGQKSRFPVKFQKVVFL